MLWRILDSAFWTGRKDSFIPFCIIEQNAVMGTANRVLQPFAKTIFLNFEETIYSSHRAISVGNPLRKEFERLAPIPPAFSRNGEQLNILVLGVA